MDLKTSYKTLNNTLRGCASGRFIGSPCLEWPETFQVQVGAAAVSDACILRAKRQPGALPS